MNLDAILRDAETPVAATSQTIDSTAADLAAAFVEDPLFDWFMRADAARTPARSRFLKKNEQVHLAARRAKFGAAHQDADRQDYDQSDHPAGDHAI